MYVNRYLSIGNSLRSTLGAIAQLGEHRFCKAGVAGSSPAGSTERMKMKDCRIIKGDKAVIISRSTAVEALAAMVIVKGLGQYDGLMADDASFIQAEMRELEKATQQG